MKTMNQIEVLTLTLVKQITTSMMFLSVLFLNTACKEEGPVSEKNFRLGEKVNCHLAPEVVNDSNYQKAAPLRTDIREDSDGLFMHYNIRVVNVNDDCKPVPYAVVDLWQADVNGQYSDNDNYAFRGTQNANPFGEVQFLSNFPGWHTEQYHSSLKPRTHHVKFKVHVKDKTVLSSEFYFPDETVGFVNQLIDPYKSEEQKQYQYKDKQVFVKRLPANKEDINYKQADGQPLIMQLERIKQGYRGDLLIGVAL